MTIKDIAAKCGVSVTTVSRVMNNHPYVSKEIRDKVLKVIEEEHFVPHVGAVDLVKPRTDAIGLIVRGTRNEFFNDMIPTLESAINDSGYAFYMSQIHTSENELRAAAALAKSKGLKGVILLGGRYDYTPEEVAILDNVPFICCTFTNSFGKISKESFSSVSIDDGRAAKAAVQLLIDNGHRKIAIILASTSDRSISELRFLGYKQALEENGIPFDADLVMETGDFSMERAYKAMKKLLSKKKEFTAAFVISDSMAVASMKALDDAGKKLPNDCSVIAIDGVKMTEYIIPTLTTFVQPREAMAKQTVESLRDIIENRSDYSHVVMKTTLREGGSVKKLQN
ncbi:MAG: LacI family transcriptional regulator [Lachnospiraceae bacterium]|nr:LacI family transcriptional regulator [Lachnospiraceae bacterium]